MHLLMVVVFVFGCWICAKIGPLARSCQNSGPNPTLRPTTVQALAQQNRLSPIAQKAHIWCKIQVPQNFRGENPNSKTLGCRIQTSPNFRGVICNLPYFFIIGNKRYYNIITISIHKFGFFLLIYKLVLIVTCAKFAKDDTYGKFIVFGNILISKVVTYIK